MNSAISRSAMIWSAVIIAVGFFLGAQRIAYVISFEGKWDSCVQTFNKNLPKINPDKSATESLCLAAMLGRSN